MPLPSRWRRRGAVLLTLVAVAWGVAWIRADDPPSPAFAEARRALAAARAAEAPRYAPEAFRAAERRWADGLAQWNEQTRRGLRRDYSAALRDAEAATAAARSAARRAAAVRDSLATAVDAGLTGLDAALARAAQRADALPFDADRQRQLAALRSRRAVAAGMQRRGELQAAAHQLTSARKTLDDAERDMEAAVRAYVADTAAWRRWRDEAVAWSEQRRAPAVVVDKMARMLVVYDRGRAVRTFAVELGPNWMGPKRYEGDRATPEGRYRVVRRRGAGETVYHRALELDYPNATDRRRFQDAARAGTLPAGARIGGLIELHGEGGRGADWTRGCIALTNADMRALFDAVPVGTPVVIVGALEAAAPAGDLLPEPR